MTQPPDIAADPIMTDIVGAVELGRTGKKVEARHALTALWERTDGDALHRCTIAHYLADLQDTTESELHWDRRALAAVTDLTDDRAQQYHASLRVQAFLPSLHLNLADDYRRLGDTRQAHHHLDVAKELMIYLPEGEYTSVIRRGLDSTTGALASGSTAPLDATDSTG